MVDLADKNAVEAKASNQGGRKSSTGLVSVLQPPIPISHLV